MAIGFSASHHISDEWANAAGKTTGSYDSSGDNFIVIGITSSFADDITNHVPTDSKSNTYVKAIGPITNGDSVGIYYCENATVGSAHTFTWTGSLGTFGVINVGSFSGMNTSSTLDQTASATGTGTTATAGSQTTTNADDLIVAVAQFGGSTDINFTALNGYATVDSRGNLDTTGSGWLGYKIVSATGTYSGNTASQSGSSATWAGAQASFKGTAAAGSPSTAQTMPAMIELAGTGGMIGRMWK